MCTNRALVNSLECYLEDLVDSFEDFVRKSVLIISIAVGLLVAMIAYVLKMTVNNSQPASTTGDTYRVGRLSRTQSERLDDRSDINSKIKKIKPRSQTVFGYQEKKDTSYASENTVDPPIDDEKVLKDIAFKSSRTKTVSRGFNDQSTENSKSRLTMPSLPTGPRPGNTSRLDQQETSKTSEKVESCCSICCTDKQ